MSTIDVQQHGLVLADAQLGRRGGALENGLVVDIHVGRLLHPKATAILNRNGPAGKRPAPHVWLVQFVDEVRI